MLELLTSGSLRSRHGDRRDRRTDVDQDGRAGPGIADGKRVGREQRLASAVGGDKAEGGIGGGQDGDAAAVRRLLYQSCEASDVMAAAHREGDHAVRRDPLEGNAERLLHQPKAR